MRKDIDLNLRPHPMTGDVVVVKEEKAVTQSIRNIVLTNFYERGFQVNFGTGVVGSLFELMTDVTVNALKRDIAQAIQNFEPQASLIAVDISEDGSNAIYINISYYFKNNGDPITTSVTLRGAR